MVQDDRYAGGLGLASGALADWGLATVRSPRRWINYFETTKCAVFVDFLGFQMDVDVNSRLALARIWICGSW